MNLFHYLPAHLYNNDPYMAEVQRVIGLEVARLWDALDDLFLQARPGTATWGLENYEIDYGIAPDRRVPDNERLQRWRAKKQGRGTTTRQLVAQVAQEMCGAPAGVDVYANDFYYEIVLQVQRALSNVEALHSLLDEIEPAHLQRGLVRKHTANTTLNIHATAHRRSHSVIGLPTTATPETALATVAYYGLAAVRKAHKIGGVQNYG